MPKLSTKPHGVRPQHILVTGGEGFLGSALIEQMLGHGHSVRSLDISPQGRLWAHPKLERIQGSVVEPELVERCLKGVELVYHLAAAVGVDHYVSDPAWVMDTNILGTRNVIKACQKHGIPLVFVSTSEVYGKNTESLHESADSIFGSMEKSRWSYALSKAVGEQYLHSYGEGASPYLITRIFNTYGPLIDDPSRPDSGRVISKFIGALQRDEPLTLVDEGQAVRSFLYIDDAATALRLLGMGLLAGNLKSGRTFNVGRADPVSISELAQLMLRLSGKAVGTVNLPGEEFFGEGFEEIPYRVPDVSALEETLGFRLQTSLEEGLKRTLAHWGLLAAKSEGSNKNEAPAQPLNNTGSLDSKSAPPSPLATQSSQALEGAVRQGADWKGSDQQNSDQQNSAQKDAAQQGADQKGSDQRGADQRGADQKGADQKGSDQQGAAQQNSDQQDSDRKDSDQKDTDQTPQAPDLLPSIRPDLPADEELLSQIRTSLRSGRVSNEGPVATRFEAQLAKYLGVDSEAEDLIVTTSGSAALQLLFQALNLPPGSVVLPSFTYIASLAPVTQLGLNPVFCDVDPQTFTLCPNHLAQILDEHQAQAKRVVAVLPVNVYGVPPALPRIAELCQSVGALLLYDNAHGLGSQQHGRQVPKEPLGQIFSLHATKVLPAVEGGAVLSRDRHLSQEIRRLRGHGLNRSSLLDSTPGLNGRLDEIRAAVAERSLAEIEEALKRRRSYATRLREHLVGLPGFRVQAIPQGLNSNFQNLALVVHPQLGSAKAKTGAKAETEAKAEAKAESPQPTPAAQHTSPRHQLIATFARHGVEVRPYFHPLLHQLRHLAPQPQLPISEVLAQHVVVLPLYSRMSEAELQKVEDAASRVSEELEKAVKGSR